METVDIIKNHPLSKEKIEGWMIKKIYKNLEKSDVNQEWVKNVISTKGKLENMINNNPTLLFEFFDEYDLIVEIGLKDSKFIFRVINRNEEELHPYEYSKTRIKTSVLAIHTLFQLLENKLKEDEKDNK